MTATDTGAPPMLSVSSLVYSHKRTPPYRLGICGALFVDADELMLTISYQVASCSDVTRETRGMAVSAENVELKKGCMRFVGRQT